MDEAVSCIGLKDLGGPVDGRVVGCDDEVDSCVQVVRDLPVHDGRLVADYQRLDEPHGRPTTGGGGSLPARPSRRSPA